MWVTSELVELLHYQTSLMSLEVKVEDDEVLMSDFAVNGYFLPSLTQLETLRWSSSGVANAHSANRELASTKSNLAKLTNLTELDFGQSCINPSMVELIPTSFSVLRCRLIFHSMLPDVANTSNRVQFYHSFVLTKEVSRRMIGRMTSGMTSGDLSSLDETVWTATILSRTTPVNMWRYRYRYGRRSPSEVDRLVFGS